MSGVFYFLVLTAFSFSFSSAAVDPTDWKCSNDFCLEYEVLYKCPSLDLNKCYNESFALIIPSPIVCTCCDHCLLLTGEGESCINGSPGQALPTQMCGPGLTCVNRKCAKMAVPGEDPLYNNAKYKCNDDGTCNCVAVENKKEVDIFGIFDKSTIGDETALQCECATLAYEAKASFPQSLPFDDIYQKTARCLPSGQFDPLQCYEGYCFCVDQYTGEYDVTIQQVAISTIAPGVPLCFNATYGHHRGYYNECEEKLVLLHRAKDITEAEGFQFLFPFKVDCKPDGSYQTPLTLAQENAFKILKRKLFNYQIEF